MSSDCRAAVDPGPSEAGYATGHLVVSKDPTRRFRVFVSSTFEDFGAEREILRRISGRLRDFSRARHVDFELIDLRWGISETAAEAHQTLEICLDEVRRSLALDTKPSFLVLVGQRYGWRPLPSRIDAALFQQLVGSPTAAAGQDAALLRRWYVLDRNAVPAQLELARSGEVARGVDWPRQEDQLRAALGRLAVSANLDGDERVRGFFKSATHHEVDAGALALGNADHLVTCFRNIEPPADHAVRWIDSDPRCTDGVAEIRHALTALAPEHLYELPAKVTEAGVDAEYLQRFERTVFDALIALMTRQLDHAPPSPDAAAEVDHARRAGELRTNFRSRAAERRWLVDAVRRAHVGAAEPLIVVTGDSGVGKSALLAMFDADARRDLAEVVIVSRFVGATPESTDDYQLMVGVIAELRRALDLPAPPVQAGSLAEIAEQLLTVLSHARPERAILVILDGIDQLRQFATEGWLPASWPSHVAMVLSAATPSLAARWLGERGYSQALEVGALKAEEATDMLQTSLSAGGRALTPEQWSVLRSLISGAATPLYVNVLFEVVRHWRSFDAASSLPDDLQDLLAVFFERVTHAQHGPVFVKRMLGFLAAARHGLSAPELLDLASRDEEIIREYKQLHPRSPQSDRIPQIIWSRLVRDLRSLITERASMGAVLFGFSHSVVLDFARSRLLVAGDRARIHSALAAYFENQEVQLHDPTGGRAVNARKAASSLGAFAS